jgi:hypothetical protein
LPNRTHQCKTKKISNTTDYGKPDKYLISQIPNFSEMYHPTEHMASYDVILKFKGKVIFGIQIYKICDRSDCTYSMSVCIWENKEMWLAQFIQTCGIVLELIQKLKELDTKYS